MFFEQQLMSILLKYEGQRTIYSAYYLLKGKKSGQTIQDVGLFNLQPYFHLLPKMTKEIFLQKLENLQRAGFIKIEEQQKIKILKKPEQREVYFNGWHLRGGEHVFFARLQLVVQSFSQSLQQQKRFLPIVKDEKTQLFVRHYLLSIQYQKSAVQKSWIEQLFKTIAAMDCDEIVKNILVYRLSGYEQIGWTWQQLGEKLQIDELDIQFYYVHGLHTLIKEIENSDAKMLQLLLQNIKVQSVLTESTQKTAQLLNQGMMLEQIAQARRLKMSTIEDHIAELAMYDPYFDVQKFVPPTIEQEIKEAIQIVGSKKLRPIKERLEHVSYFQIRLVLAVVGGEANA